MKDQSCLLENQKNFKEKIKNVFLQLNDMIISFLLLDEHIGREINEDERENLTNEIIKEVSTFEKKISKSTSEIVAKLFEKLKGMQNFVDTQIESNQKSFMEEYALISNQTKKLKSLKYDADLDKNIIFQARINDFLRILMPEPKNRSRVQSIHESFQIKDTDKIEGKNRLRLDEKLNYQAEAQKVKSDSRNNEESLLDVNLYYVPTLTFFLVSAE